MSGEACVFCGYDEIVHRHHIIPRRYGGSDREDNLLPVCPNCHAIIEGTYGDEFYEHVGVERRAEIQFETVQEIAQQITRLAKDTSRRARDTPLTDERRPEVEAELEGVVNCLEIAVSGLIDDTGGGSE